MPSFSSAPIYTAPLHQPLHVVDFIRILRIADVYNILHIVSVACSVMVESTSVQCKIEPRKASPSQNTEPLLTVGHDEPWVELGYT
jgi:methylglyoxal synthase